MRRTFGAAVVTLGLLAACENSPAPQFSSGADYLQKWEEQIGAAPAANPEAPDMTMSSALRQAAGVEFTFPAEPKIGLARIERTRWTDIPAQESELWAELVHGDRSPIQFGTVSPLVGAMTAQEVGFGCTRFDLRGCQNALSTLNMIRLGAARQHFDVVIIYEVGVRSKKENTGIAFADLTILGGAILPTRRLKAAGVAKALVMDVRNGYPYATASAFADLSAFSASWGSDARRHALHGDAAKAVVEKLAPDVGAALAQLLVYAKGKADAAG